MSSSTHRETTGDAALRIGAEEIAELLRTFAGSGWTGMHLTIGDVTVSVGKDAPPPASAFVAPAPAVDPAPVQMSSPPPTAAVPSAAVPSAVAPSSAVLSSAVTSSEEPTAAEIDETGLVPVASPTVGAFWTAPDPGSAPFVEVGTHVQPGDQLAIVEVMKLMNPVLSEVSGEIVAIRARNAEMVEFGQPLFLIRPDD